MSTFGRFRKVLAAGAAAVLVVAVAPLGVDPVGASTPTPYYLALGDSLAQGVQPNSSGQSVETDQGYVNDLYSLYRHLIPGLKLVDLGCPGETTGTMISGGICTYTEGVTSTDPLGNQLAQAVGFLRTHHVVLVTIDIGANNVDGCLSASGINETCIEQGFIDAGSQLPVILATLQAAAPHVRIAAMNYYDPFLAAWLQGAAGQTLATESVGLATEFNGLLGQVYGDFGVPVADVQDAFQTTDFTPVPIIGLPLNVAVICGLTWMCAPPPRGPNIHANVFGYALIAFTFERTLAVL